MCIFVLNQYHLALSNLTYAFLILKLYHVLVPQSILRRKEEDQSKRLTVFIRNFSVKESSRFTFERKEETWAKDKICSRYTKERNDLFHIKIAFVNRIFEDILHRLKLIYLFPKNILLFVYI